MVAAPATTPVTIPDVPTVAIDPVALVHIPPKVASVNGIVVPGQTVEGPPMIAGNGFIEAVTEREQPVVDVSV